jgi:hypothetical protein
MRAAVIAATMNISATKSPVNHPPRDRPHRRHDHRPAGAELAQPDDRHAEHGQDGEHRDQDRAEFD